MTGGRTGSLAPKLVAAVAAATAALTFASSPAPAHERDGAGEQRRHVARRARSQIDAPYSYGGSSPGGFDCSGFTTWVFDGHGEELPRSSMDQYRLSARDGYRRIHLRKNLKKGDLVFHKTTSAKVGHVGIYLGDGKFISTTSSEGVQVRSLYDPYYWGDRWVGGVRLPTTRR